MTQGESVESAEKRPAGTTLPPPKWWGRVVSEGNPPRQRFVVNWGRTMGVLAGSACAIYLMLITGLWAYFSFYRKIPGVSWFDVAVITRFERVQKAMGAHYFSEAKRLWQEKNYAQAVMTGRAAVLKNPQSLEARIFLADCWLQAGRTEEALRIMKEGLSFGARSEVFQDKIVEVARAVGRPVEVLTLLREDFPAQGVRLLEAGGRNFQIAELVAVLDLEGAASAEALVRSRAGLADEPKASPVMARIDWDLNRPEQALARLSKALERAPGESAIHESYIEAALRLNRLDDARRAADRFLTAFPANFGAHLKYLEVHGSRVGNDVRPWDSEYTRVLAQYSSSAPAMAQLASLAASQGWPDVAFLLYQDSLQRRLNGFPFVVYYIASLVKAGDYAVAEGIWRELTQRNASQLTSADHLEALVLQGVGRESEAMQVVERLRHETESAPDRRRTVERVFRSFGFTKLAEQLIAPKPSLSVAE